MYRGRNLRNLQYSVHFVRLYSNLEIQKQKSVLPFPLCFVFATNLIAVRQFNNRARIFGLNLFFFARSSAQIGFFSWYKSSKMPNSMALLITWK